MSNYKLLRYSLYCALFFILLSGVYRGILPFGDEPDFDVRAPRVVLDSHPSWSPYNWLSPLYDDMQYSSHCEIDATPLSLSARIDVESCSESLYQRSTRWLLMIILSAPLLFSSVFYYRKNDGVDVRHRMHSLALSLIFPGTIYYLGVFAEEQLSLIVSLLCFMYWKRKSLVLFLIVIVLLLDFGNGLVVASFFSMALFYTFVSKKFGFRNACIIMLIQVVCCYAIGFSILEYTKNISFLANKSEAIFLALESKELIDKYPVVLRPVITFMSFVFYTPAFLKVPVVYIIVGVACLLSLLKTYMKRGSINGNAFLESLLLCVISISFIVSFVFLFPSYANAKYYIFLLPFVICPLLYIYDKYLSLLFFVTLNIFVFLHLIYFSI